MSANNQATVIAEYRLCNAIYQDPNLLDDPQYTPDLFIHAIPKDFCKAIDEMTRDGTPLNRMAIFQKLSEINMNVTIDEVDAIIGIDDKPTPYIKDIVTVLKDANRKQQALIHLDTLKKLLTEDKDLTEDQRDKLRKEFDECESSIFKLDNSIKRIMTMKEWGDKWNEEAKKRRNGKQFYFNDPILDEIVVDGPYPGTIGLFCAGTGCGKTTMVSHLYNGFLNAEIPCMFFSLEMGAVPTYDRILSSRLQIKYTDMVNPGDVTMFDNIMEQVEEERKTLDNNKLTRFCEDAGISLSDIKRAVLKFQEEIGQRYCIVIVDLVTMVKEFSKSAQNMAQQMEIAINEMSALAKELGCHFICTAQMKREKDKVNIVDPEDIDRLRPDASSIKNSGALLERCRYSLSLFRKRHYMEQYFPDDEELLEITDDVMEVSTLKQNNGKCPRRYYSFNGSCFTITPMLNTEMSMEEE